MHSFWEKEMSTTIGLAYSSTNSADLFNEVESLANTYGYGLVDGLDAAEEDAISGIRNAMKTFSLRLVHLLQSPIDRNIALAPGIDRELLDFELTGKPPKFFRFLTDLRALLSGKCEVIYVFFSCEWYEDTRARFSYGSMDGLITLLSSPGNWNIRYIIGGTNIVQDTDETPLIFRVTL